MPTPAGHIMIAEIMNRYDEAGWSNTTGSFIAAVVLVNFPDVDMPISWLINGDSGYYHREFTHSLFFAFVFGPIFSIILARLGLGVFTARRCVLILFSHTASDYLLSPSPMTIFWPLKSYTEMPHLQLVNIFLRQDLPWPLNDLWSGAIISFCSLMILLLWQKYKSLKI